MRTRVKICGITNERDLAHAVAAGADAIGFMLFDQSSRAITPTLLETLARHVPPFVTRVGVFVNPDAALVQECLDRVDLLQFHGDEPEDFCLQFNKPYIKVIRVATEADVAEGAYSYETATAIMLETHVEGQYGGTGVAFDWQLAKGVSSRVILAGGLNPENVAGAIRVLGPYAVDVSGGVELARGKKDPVKMNAFVAAVRAADEVAK